MSSYVIADIGVSLAHVEAVLSKWAFWSFSAAVRLRLLRERLCLWCCSILVSVQAGSRSRDTHGKIHGVSHPFRKCSAESFLGGDLFTVYQNSSITPTRGGCHLGQAGLARCPADHPFFLPPSLTGMGNLREVCSRSLPSLDNHPWKVWLLQPT